MVYNITAINSTGLDTVYQGIFALNPWLMPTILFFEFIVILLSGVYAQNRRIGFSNVPMWGTIAGLVTTTSGFILTAISGVIDPLTLTLSISVTILCAAIFLLTDLD